MGETAPLKPEKTPIVKPLYERIEEKKAVLEKARNETRLQLNGIENQLFLIDQLLNPEPPSASPKQEEPPDGYV